MTENLDEDQQWIAESIEGKQEAFAHLVRKYQDRLYNTLVHVTGSSHDAEEIAQDALLQAYQKLHTFRGNSAFYTWLYRIAFNLSVSRSRKRRPRMSLDELKEQHDLDLSGKDEESAESQLERAERMNQLYAAMDKLSDEFRQILVLREMDACDYESIAEMLQIPVGTVRSRLHRARTMLKQHLEQSINPHEL